MLNRAFQHVQVAFGWGLLWLLLGPTYLAANLDDRYRRASNLPDRIHHFGGWIDAWRKGALTGLIAGSGLGFLCICLSPPQDPHPAQYFIAFLGCCGISLGGAIGVICGGRNAEASSPAH